MCIRDRAPIVFMGGSLVPHGGQNPIEAIKLGASVIFFASGAVTLWQAFR